MREKTTEFLKECIADAILELLHEKPLEKITSDEICKRSGVGRATYFRYFKSKEDAIIFKRSLLWRRYCDKEGIEVRERFYLGNAPLFFKFVYEIRDINTLLYETGNEKMLYGYYNRLAEHPSLSIEEQYREKFLLMGLMGVLDIWVRTGFQDSPEQMAQRLYEIANSVNYEIHQLIPSK